MIAYAIDNVAAFVAGEKPGGKSLGKLVDLKVKRRRETGRVDLLELLFERGKLEVGGDRSRWVFGRPSKNTPILPSANYKLTFDAKGSKWTRVTIHGKGYGHGVGMCQCGAIGRARGGQKHDEILRAYYTGASLDREY